LENLPIEIKRLFVGIEDTPTFLMWVFPKGMLFDFKKASKFVNEIRYVNKIKKESIDVSGETFILSDILDLVKTDGMVSIVLALIAVIAILLIDFRKVKTAILVLCPLLVGFLYLFAIMEIFIIKVNFLNMVMFL